MTKPLGVHELEAAPIASRYVLGWAAPSVSNIEEKLHSELTRKETNPKPDFTRPMLNESLRVFLKYE
jgi:hypothetical protein